MKILVIGGGGMLGHKLVQVLAQNLDVWTTLRTNYSQYEKFKIFDKTKTIENINVEEIKSVEKVIEKLKPDVVVNAVGVIKQLPSAKNVIKTLTINSIFPHQLAEISKQMNCRLINISTDCVFSGKKGKYVETDVADAEDLYGKSKNLGEVAEGNCLTIRTSIIGRELSTSHSLVEWFLSNEGKSVKGFTKAIFSGFSTLALAEIISDLIENHQNLNGLYHVSNEPIDKFTLLQLLKDAYQANIEIEAFEDFQIDRSLDSSEFKKITGFKAVPWDKMIKIMAEDKTPYRNL